MGEKTVYGQELGKDWHLANLLEEWEAFVVSDLMWTLNAPEGLEL